MIQLTFQPAFDSFHTMFRFLRLRPIISTAVELPIDHVRMLDFFLVFPFRLAEMTMKREHRRFGGAIRKYAEAKPYENQPTGKALFAQMIIRSFLRRQ